MSSGFEFNEEDVRRQVAGKRDASGSLTASSKAFVCFRMHAILDADATAKRGYPVFKEAVYFSRRDISSGKPDGVDRPANENDLREHPEALRALKEWMQDPQIPVYHLPYLSPVVLRLLDEGQISTIQQLAQAPNLTFLNAQGEVIQRVAIDSVPELTEARALARQWLGKRPTRAVTAIPETETERLRRELAEAQAQLNARGGGGAGQVPLVKMVKKRGGRKPGSKNKPKAAPHVANTQTDS
jgi:hypothetical protein